MVVAKAFHKLLEQNKWLNLINVLWRRVNQNIYNNRKVESRKWHKHNVHNH